MIDELKWISYLTEREYTAGSFNGPAFIQTVRKLTVEQAADADTHDGYTSWAIVLHDAYFKWKVLEFFHPGRHEWPYERKSFPAIPEATDENWQATISFSDEIHGAYLALLDKLTSEDVEREIPEWECSVGQALAWIATHDSYHAAQIRNMGVKGL